MGGLTEQQKKILTSLKFDVTYLPGSYDKRFVNSMPLDGISFTEKQIAYIEKLGHKYRRQIK